MNLGDLIELSIPVQIHVERCIRTFSTRSSCRKCVQVCPIKGLKIEANQPPVVEECIGCGHCVQVCPLNVFTMDFSEVLDTKEEPLVLMCHKNRIEDAKAIKTHCLQQFTWLSLVQLLEKHQDVYLYSDKKVCDECECQWFPVGQTILMEKNGFANKVEKIHPIQNQEEFESLFRSEKETLLLRRQFLKNQFSAIKNTSKQYASKTIDSYSNVVTQSISQTETLSFEKSQSIALMAYDLLKNVSEKQGSEEVLLENLTNSACNFCKICEQMCPWEAMAIVEEDGHAILAHHTVLCSRCGLCIDLCPTNGLHWEQGLTVKDLAQPKWMALAEADRRTCERCGEDFYSTKENQVRCAICENKL